jgi:hypothetical protein
MAGNSKKKKQAQPNTGESTAKGLFDFVNAITADQSMKFFEELSDMEKKAYKNSRYMIHRFLSMNMNYAPVVNIAQKYTSMPERAHYLFLTNILPKGKQYNKYIKGSKDDRYESWLVDLIAKHYDVSQVEAISYLEIYYKDDKPALRSLCEKYGVDPKVIKKVKL